MAQNTSKGTRRRVTRKQLQQRRIMGLAALLLIIFLLSSGCASCIRCACGTDEPASQEIQPATEIGTDVTTAPAAATTTTVTTTSPPQYLVSSLPDSHQIPVTALSQYPELPTGNEITSLTMVLNHLGFEVTKEILANNFLTCAEPGEATFSQAFIGSPFDSSGYGCFSQVIIDTAQKYLKSQNSGRYVKTLNADNFDDLLYQVASNYPVLVWCSQDLEPINEEYCFTIYGSREETPAVTTAPAEGASEEITTTTQAETRTDVYWITNSTCVVLTGFDLENNTVTVIDPAQGEVTYNMEMFKSSYNALYKQAVIIY